MKRGWIILLAILLTISTGISIFLLINTYEFPINKKEHSKRDETITFNTGAPFLTNIKDGKSILRCDIYIEVDNKRDIGLLETEIPKIRDRIIAILRDLTIEEVGLQDIQNRLKIEMKSDLREHLGIESITEIYFNEFVIQH
ncbi:MAG: flagellar basal body-associated FliL family protein [Clostridiales bacterium]|nr:flagellar basal body-associated FliL family protein [Clostridiales bacterium]